MICQCSGEASKFVGKVFLQYWLLHYATSMCDQILYNQMNILL